MASCRKAQRNKMKIVLLECIQFFISLESNFNKIVFSERNECAAHLSVKGKIVGNAFYAYKIGIVLPEGFELQRISN